MVMVVLAVGHDGYDGAGCCCFAVVGIWITLLQYGDYGGHDGYGCYGGYGGHGGYAGLVRAFIAVMLWWI